MDACVVITIVLRVRALRTECGVGPAQRRRADCSCLRGNGSHHLKTFPLGEATAW